MPASVKAVTIDLVRVTLSLLFLVMGRTATGPQHAAGECNSIFGLGCCPGPDQARTVMRQTHEGQDLDGFTRRHPDPARRKVFEHHVVGQLQFEPEPAVGGDGNPGACVRTPERSAEAYLHNG
jgi:hypothetical protein